ncbi:tetratricopeptide repeat protein [Flavisolibacter nicotianae]|uniref:tetratricopeptide repeat protein n=1 Tax=Flavisolibacter nicotianae TaxID=2364882 RepID=UPI0013C431B9|nr:tetratricopeptide repeat protein [Flavisolibacter nicotianae]
MKTVLFFFSSISVSLAAVAQSVEQGKQQLYYERYQSAEQTFRQAVQQNPSDAEALYGLVQANLLQNKSEAAMTALSNAPGSLKEEPLYQVASGAVLLQQGKATEAAAVFEKALSETKEKNPAVLSAIAEAHIRSTVGDANYAVTLLNKAIKREKHDAALYTLLGDAYRKLHNGTEAYKAYQKAIEENGQYAAAYHRLGNIFLSQKNVPLYTEYFTKAINADAAYAPSIYRLYAHEFYRDPAKALAYYQEYLSKSDRSEKALYELADLFYLTKKYDSAIQKANEILSNEGTKAQPRLYKLIAYSFAGKADTASALTSMQTYFDKGADSTIIGRDYLTMGDFYAASKGKDSLAMVYYAKGVDDEKDSIVRYAYYKKLAGYAGENKDYAAQAKWLEKYYTGNSKANNLDLFTWGLAHIRAEQYSAADSVFSTYVAKYPDQSYGYYWQAKSKALQDSGMKEGLAVPAYEKLVAILEKDSTDANYKRWIVEAYGYLAAYKTNTEKNYGEAVDYFEKVLAVDPSNADAKKYITLLEKNIADKGSK